MEIETATPNGRRGTKQNYETPWAFIRAVEEKLTRRVVFDLAASPANAKAEHFWTRDDNSLLLDWHVVESSCGVLWLNPEFNDIPTWAAKAHAATSDPRCLPVAMLTPASVGSNWFRDFVFGKARVLFLNGRIIFDGQSEPEDWKEKHPGKRWKPDPYMKDLMLTVFGWRNSGGELRTGFEIWSWMEGGK